MRKTTLYRTVLMGTFAHPDWPKFIQAFRDAGMKAYAAAQSRQDPLCGGHHDNDWRELPRQVAGEAYAGAAVQLG